MSQTNTPPRACMTHEGLNIPATPFLNSLGNGTGINVWELKNSEVRSPWAVKSVRRGMLADFQQRYQSLIVKEAAVLADIHHEHIIGYRGLLNSTDGGKCLAMESFGRSLGDIIEDREVNTGEMCTPSQILTVVKAMAKALHYLHTEKSLLHGDIKSYNILIKGDFDMVKLCDFGVSVKLNEKGIADHYVGTTVYNAPEVVNKGATTTPITAKSEIFSLGLVIWEMLTLQPPHCQTDSETSFYDSTLNTSQFNESGMSEISMLNELPTAGTRPPLPYLGQQYEFVSNLFMKCTEMDPLSRPSALEVLNAIISEESRNK